VATFKVRVRGVNLTVLEFIAKVMGAKAVNAVMATSQAVSAIAEGVALFYIVTCLATPIAHFVVVFAPGVQGTVTDGSLSPSSSFAFEIRGLVHVTVNAATDAGNGIGGGKSLRALIHGQSFGLQGLFENSNAVSKLCGFGVVSAEVLNFPDECHVIFLV